MISTISPVSSYSFSSSPITTLPFGRQPVGEESADLKLSTLKPLEQPADSARGENRRFPDEHPNDIGEQERLRKGQDRSVQHRQQKEADTEQERIEIEQQEIRELAATDREVRAHEQAHAAIGGKHAGSPVYEFVRGPDGISYAVSGEVSINTSPVPGNPEATIAKAQQIRRAANAPAEPSNQDRRVAADAAQMEAQANTELRQERMLEATKKEQVMEASQQTVQVAGSEDQVAVQSSEIQSNEVQSTEAQSISAHLNNSLQRRLRDMGVVDAPTSIGDHFNKSI